METNLATTNTFANTVRIFTLLATALFLPILLTSSIFAPYAITITAAVLTAHACWALMLGQRGDVILASALAVFFLAGPWIFPAYAETPLLVASRVIGVAAYLLFLFVIALGPLSHLWNGVHATLPWRRHIGVAVFLAALAHASINLLTLYSFNLSQAFSLLGLSFGLLSLTLLCYMAVTSWNVFQFTLSQMRWKQLHFMLFLLTIALMWWLLRIQDSGPVGLLQILVFLSVLAYWMWSSPWGIARWRSFPVNGWRQLHRLTYPTLALLALHIWVMAVRYSALSIRILFVLSIVVVIVIFVLANLRRLLLEK
jgi:DMSO/TMAO reductase YedYZ heme-binding membrane subunit